MTNQPWGTIREITLEEIPPARVGKWVGLLEECKLRIGRTSRNRAIYIPIPEAADVKPAHAALVKATQYIGGGAPSKLICAALRTANAPARFSSRSSMANPLTFE